MRCVDGRFSTWLEWPCGLRGDRAILVAAKLTSGGRIRALVYIGLPDNPQFLGPQDPDALAEHIVKSRGPSGENREYVYLLAESLTQLSKDAGVDGVEVDEHAHDLARRVKEAERRLEGAK